MSVWANDCALARVRVLRQGGKHQTCIYKLPVLVGTDLQLPGPCSCIYDTKIISSSGVQGPFFIPTLSQHGGLPMDPVILAITSIQSLFLSLSLDLGLVSVYLYICLPLRSFVFSFVKTLHATTRVSWASEKAYIYLYS